VGDSHWDVTCFTYGVGVIYFCFLGSQPGLSLGLGLALCHSQHLLSREAVLLHIRWNLNLISAIPDSRYSAEHYSRLRLSVPLERCFLSMSRFQLLV